MKVSHALLHTLEEVSIIDGVFVKVVVKIVAGFGKWGAWRETGHKGRRKMTKVWKVKSLDQMWENMITFNRNAQSNHLSCVTHGGKGLPFPM